MCPTSSANRQWQARPHELCGINSPRAKPMRRRFSNISQPGFRLLVENNADGVLVTNLAGIVLYANPAAAQILGKPEEELLDSPIGRPLVCGEFVEIAIPIC